MIETAKGFAAGRLGADVERHWVVKPSMLLPDLEAMVIGLPPSSLIMVSYEV